jgi:hypothetical protein
VASIEAWLETVVHKAAGRGLLVRSGQQAAEKAEEKYRWEVVAERGNGLATPWDCTVEYDPETPRVCEVRLTSTQHDPIFVDNPGPLLAACAEQGVQPHASEERRWVEWEGERRVVRWGARQFLAVNSLNEALFWAVVRRLDQAMQDALVRAGVKAPPEPAAYLAAWSDGPAAENKR